MFNKDFYPTPPEVAEKMLNGYDVSGKNILEPSAGKGDLVDVLLSHGAKVSACENNADLRKILITKCQIIENDFLKLASDKVSHMDFIVMNPPFSADEKHILHAWEIAPAGCIILALCNLETVSNRYYQDNKRIKELIAQFGNYEDLENCFSDAQRKTDVDVALVRLQKPASNYDSEFSGFFMGEDEPEIQGNGLMPYNVIRDLVNRYVAAVKLFDKQLEAGIEMDELLKMFVKFEYDNAITKIGFQCTPEEKIAKRGEFKKELQKQGWQFIFSKMNMNKYSTKGLREDINKFVEKQTQIPFTMRNIYMMLQIVVGTTEQRMDKAILEVFERLTEHYHDNRFHVEGWKTNSHYLVNKKFIFPYGAEKGWSGNTVSIRGYGSNGELLRDVEKALCYISGENYDTINGISNLKDMTAGQWYYTHFFKVRAYKKGTIHCEFQDEELWGKFNQHIAKLKGYPLYEYKTPTSKKENEESERRDGETAKRYKPEILFEVTI